MILILINFMALLAHADEPREIVQIRGPQGFCLVAPKEARTQMISTKCDENPDQKFNLEKRDDGSYFIRSEKNQFCLSPYGLTKTPKAKIVEWHCTEGIFDQWQLKESRVENKKVLVNKGSGLCLTFRGLMITQEDCGAFNLVDQAVTLDAPIKPAPKGSTGSQSQRRQQ